MLNNPLEQLPLEDLNRLKKCINSHFITAFKKDINGFMVLVRGDPDSEKYFRIYQRLLTYVYENEFKEGGITIGTQSLRLVDAKILEQLTNKK